MVLYELTIGDVMRGEVEVVEGEGTESERKYVMILVGKHKTSKACGPAIISVPVSMYKELMKFIKLIGDVFGLDDDHPVFCTEEGGIFADTSGINKCLQDSYAHSGMQIQFLQKFTATTNRKLITTESRNIDPSVAALIAAQLCHSVAMSDRSYVLLRQKQLSSKAVHFADIAIRERTEQEKTRPVKAVDMLANEDHEARQQLEKEARQTDKEMENETTVESGSEEEESDVEGVAEYYSDITFDAIPLERGVLFERPEN